MVDIIGNGINALFSTIYDGFLYLFKGIESFLYNITSYLLGFFKSNPQQVNDKSFKAVNSYDVHKTVSDFIQEDNIDGLFNLMQRSLYNAKNLCFTSKEIDSLVDYIRDVQVIHKNISDDDYYILTDSLTFSLTNPNLTGISIDINKDILFNQIKDKFEEEVLPDINDESDSNKVYKVLTPILNSGHFYLLELSVSYLKTEEELKFTVLESKLHNSMGHTNNNLVNALTAMLSLPEFGFKNNLEVINLSEQKDAYSCGPRVIKMMIDKLNIYSDEILATYSLLRPLKDLEHGTNPYKEMVYLLKDANNAKESKYLISFMPKI